MTRVPTLGRRGSGTRRRKTVSTRVKDAIAILISDREATVETAAKAVGMSASSLIRNLREPGPRALYVQGVRSILDGSALKAARALDDLIGSAESEYVRADASKFIVDRMLPRADRSPVPPGGGIRITIHAPGTAGNPANPAAVTIDAEPELEPLEAPDAA